MHTITDSFIDFVKCCPSEMSRIRTAERGIQVLTHLMERHKLPAAELIRYTISFEHGDALLLWVADRFRGTDQWYDFIDELGARAVQIVQDGFWDQQTIRDIVSSDNETVKYVIRQHMEFVKDAYHPFELKQPDRYWEPRVRWHLAKKDYRRTWDELKKAFRGFYVGEPGEAMHDYWERDYIYRASKPLVENLLWELFNAMVEDDIIKPLTLDDQTPELREANRYSTISRNGKLVDVPYGITNSAAHHLAQSLGFKYEDTARFVLNRPKFGEAGAAALKIDAHFRQLRDADRRRRVTERVHAKP